MLCFRKCTVTGIGIMSALLSFSSAHSQELTLTSGFPPGAIAHIAQQKLAEWAADNTDMKISVTAMTLLSLQETVAGLRDGIADMGYVLTQYYPAEFANSNLAADMSMLTTIGTAAKAPGLVMAGAFAEYVLFNCEDCQQEFSNENQLFLGSGASSSYALMCNTEVRSPADLRGMRIRVGAGSFGRWVEHFGGIRVSMPASEMYEALSQGVVSCTPLALPDMTNWQIYDVLTHVVVGVPGGVYGGVASNNINLDSWRALTEQQRGKLLEGSAYLTAGNAVGYEIAAKEAEARARSEGIDIYEATDELRSASDEFVKQDMASIEKEFTSLYGVKDAKQKMQIISALIEKWKGIMSDVDTTNVDTVGQVYWENLYSKVDPASYGLE